MSRRKINIAIVGLGFGAEFGFTTGQLGAIGGAGFSGFCFGIIIGGDKAVHLAGTSAEAAKPSRAASSAPADSPVAGQQRLFPASFITQIAAGVGCSSRSGILDDWGGGFAGTGHLVRGAAAHLRLRTEPPASFLVSPRCRTPPPGLFISQS